MRLPLRLRPHHLLSTFIVLTFSLPFPSLFQTYKLWMFLQSDRISGISFPRKFSQRDIISLRLSTKHFQQLRTWHQLSYQVSGGVVSFCSRTIVTDLSMIQRNSWKDQSQMMAIQGLNMRVMVVTTRAASR